MTSFSNSKSWTFLKSVRERLWHTFIALPIDFWFLLICTSMMALFLACQLLSKAFLS